MLFETLCVCQIIIYYHLIMPSLYHGIATLLYTVTRLVIVVVHIKLLKVTGFLHNIANVQSLFPVVLLCLL